MQSFHNIPEDKIILSNGHSDLTFKRPLRSNSEQHQQAGGARMGQADQRGSGARKSPKQELMSIRVLGKNKPHLKSHRIPKQLQQHLLHMMMERSRERGWFDTNIKQNISCMCYIKSQTLRSTYKQLEELYCFFCLFCVGKSIVCVNNTSSFHLSRQKTQEASEYRKYHCSACNHKEKQFLCLCFGY